MNSLRIRCQLYLYNIIIPEDTEVAEIIDEKAIKAAEQTRYLNKLKELLLTAAEVLEKKGETELVREIRDAV